jgi:hypothetical protein
MSAEHPDTIDILINVIRDYAFDEVKLCANGTLRVRGLCPEVQGHYGLVSLNERLECSIACDNGCNSGGDSLMRDFEEMFQTALRQKLNAEQPPAEQQVPALDDSDREQAEAPSDSLHESVNEQPLEPESAPEPEESPSAAAADKSESDSEHVPPGRYPVRMRIYAYEKDKSKPQQDAQGKPLWRKTEKGEAHWLAKCEVLDGPQVGHIAWDRFYFSTQRFLKLKSLYVALGLLEEVNAPLKPNPKELDGTLWWLSIKDHEWAGYTYRNLDYAPLSSDEAKNLGLSAGGITDPTAATHDEYCAQHCRLLPHHRQLIIDSGIKPEIARDRAYRSVLTQAELRNAGFRTSRQSVPTLLIPSYGPKGELAGYQHRPDTPRSKGNPPKPVKYESPGKKPLRIDVPLALTRKSTIQNDAPYFDTTEVPAPIVNPLIPLFITEGARKADSAVSIELCCISLAGVWGWRGSNAAGGKAALPDWDDIPLNDRVVYIVFDSDVMTNAQVHAALRRLQAFLTQRGAIVRFIYLLPGPQGEKAGLDDFIATEAKAGATPDQVRAKLLELAVDELRPNVNSTKPEDDDDDSDTRPSIIINNRQLRRKVRAALQALRVRNEPPFLFTRDGSMVRLRAKGDELEEVDSQVLLAELAEAANWFVETKLGQMPVDPPPKVGMAILGTRQLPFPHLEGIVRAPFFTPEGELVVEPGYHPQARVYLAPDAALAEQLATLTEQFGEQPFSETPTDEDVRWALEKLSELFCDFPFAAGRENRGRAHALALTLLPFVRLMIDGPTPNHAVSAPERGEGTGKGLLIQVACVPGMGEVDASPETGDAEEIRKVLSAAILENAPIVWFDNIKREVNSGPLASILTARGWADRILGKSKRFHGRVLTTWCIAGNGLRFSREMGRRTVMIALDANMPRAWTRTGFKHELPQWALDNRAILIRACIILVRNWIAKGCNPGKRTLGSYEKWARVMGGILEAAGIEGFLEDDNEQPEETDREGQRWNPFIAQWWDEHGSKAVTAQTLLPLAADIVPEEEGKSDRSRAVRLGAMLTQRLNATFEVDSASDHYLKILRAEVQGVKSRAYPGYELVEVPKHTSAEHSSDCDHEKPRSRSGTSGTYPDTPENATEIKGNSVPDLDQKPGATFPYQGDAQVLENKGNFKSPGSPGSQRGDFDNARSENVPQVVSHLNGVAVELPTETDEERAEIDRLAAADADLADDEGEIPGSGEDDDAPLLRMEMPKLPDVCPCGHPRREHDQDFKCPHCHCTALKRLALKGSGTDGEVL